VVYWERAGFGNFHDPRPGCCGSVVIFRRGVEYSLDRQDGRDSVGCRLLGFPPNEGF